MLIFCRYAMPRHYFDYFFFSMLLLLIRHFLRHV